MNMVKKKFIRLIAAVMAFAMTAVLAGCGKEPVKETEPTAAPDTSYLVTVANKAGTPIVRCSVEIYADTTKSNQIYKGITNGEGQVQFTAPASDAYVAVVSKLPTGYAPVENYPLTGESTAIVVTPGVMTDGDLDTVRYGVGDAMMDFSVTLPGGEAVVLSELLQGKKAVVLNFWFMKCDPCKMEFPYIQEGYEQLSDDIAVLAMNPMDGTDEEITQFQSGNGYSFMMAKCDKRWEKVMDIQAYPTTVVIDRYGNIALIHSSMLTSTQDFLDLVEYFIQDDYVQKLD